MLEWLDLCLVYFATEYMPLTIILLFSSFFYMLSHGVPSVSRCFRFILHWSSLCVSWINSFFFPFWFKYIACIVIFPVFFSIQICPIQVRFLFFICIEDVICGTSSQISWMHMQIGKYILSILRSSLFIFVKRDLCLYVWLFMRLNCQIVGFIIGGLLDSLPFLVDALCRSTVDCQQKEEKWQYTVMMNSCFKFKHFCLIMNT